MFKTFVVAGGGGFIGHHLVPKLAAINRQVLVVDPFITHSALPRTETDPIIDYRYYLLKRVPGVDVRETTIATVPWDYATTATDMFRGSYIDCWVHLASMPREAEAKQNPIEATRLMTEALIESLLCAKRLKVKRFVFVSSSMVYGDFSSPVNESAPTNPIGIYGILKLSGEMLVKNFARENGMEYVIVRPTAVYGPGDLPDRVIPRFFDRAIKKQTLEVHGGSEVLDFTYVDDTAQGIFLAATVDAAANKTYNISNGATHRITAAANAIVDLVGAGSVVVVPKQKNFPSRNALDISAARQDLGYCPTIDLYTGLQLQHQWLTELYLSLA